MSHLPPDAHRRLEGEHLAQDLSRPLTDWLASKPDAMRHAREAAALVESERVDRLLFDLRAAIIGYAEASKAGDTQRVADTAARGSRLLDQLADLARGTPTAPCADRPDWWAITYLGEPVSMFRHRASAEEELTSRNAKHPDDAAKREVRPVWVGAAPQPAPEAVPLTDEQIIAIRQQRHDYGPSVRWGDTLGFACAIERAHGIDAAREALKP